MKTNSILLAAVALSLAACATPGPTPNAFAPTLVQPGISTRDDVAKLLGPPIYTYNVPAKHVTESTYGVKGVWGNHGRLWVTYNENGVVTSTFTENIDNY